MSDYWDTRMKARWDYEEYRRGSIGTFFRVVAILHQGDQEFLSTIAELIRVEEVAVLIVEDHNKALGA